MTKTVVRAGIIALVTVAALSVSAWASDRTTAKVLVVTPADAGNAYTAAKATPMPDISDQLASCVGTPVPQRTATISLDGSDLTNHQSGALISSSVEFVKTQAMANADRAVAANPKFPDCLAQIIQTQGASQGITSVTAQRASVPHFGDYSTAVLVEASATSNGQAVTETVVEVGTFKGRAELVASFALPGSQPFDQATAVKILSKVNQRLKHASVA